MISGSDAAITLGALRRVLLGILLFGMAGTTTELLLLQHLEDVSQAIPLALLGCGYAVVAWNSWRHSRLSVTAMQIVMVLFASANRDEHVFPAGDTFQIERDSRDHVTFGHGVHYCLGAQLARIETAEALRGLNRRTVTLAPNEPANRTTNPIPKIPG